MVRVKNLHNTLEVDFAMRFLLSVRLEGKAINEGWKEDRLAYRSSPGVGNYVEAVSIS
jgi:hypothetical protein